MVPAHPPADNFPNRDDLEEVVYRFDQAWLSGVAPRIEDFLPGEVEARRQVLEELIKIDLECRWRLAAPVSHARLKTMPRVTRSFSALPLA